MFKGKIDKLLEKEMYKRSIFILLLTLTFLFGSGFFYNLDKEDKDYSDIVNQARDYLRSGNYTGTIESLAVLNKVNDNNVYKKRSFFLLGKAHLYLGNYKEALDYFIKAENSLSILRDYALYYQGLVFFQQKKYHPAREKFYEVIKDYPHKIIAEKAYLKIGEGFFWEESLKKAKKIFEEIGASNNTPEISAATEYFLARIKEDLGQKREAYQDYRNILNKYPESFYAGQIRGKFKGDLESLIIDAKTRFIFAESLYKEGEYKEAREDYEVIIKDHKGSDYFSEALFKLGMCEYNLRDYDLALSHLKLYVQNFINAENRGQALYWLGRAYSARGKKTDAVRTFDTVVKCYPKTPWAPRALYFLNRYYLNVNSTMAAYKVCRKMMKDYKGHYLLDDVMWSGGWYRYKSGSYKGAVNYWNNVKEYAPNGDMTAGCLYWMGKLKEKMGDYKDAYELYKHVYNNYYFSYYGFRVYDRFKDKWSLKRKNVENQVFFKDAIDDKMAVLMDKFRELVFAEELDDAFLEVKNKINLTKDEELKKKLKIVLGYLYIDSRDYNKAIEYAIEYFRQDYRKYKDMEIPSDVWRLYYPLGFKYEVWKWAEKRRLDPYFVLGLIREESRFKANARSWANAYGLMQIIPSTGRSIARSLGINNFRSSDMNIPDINIKMGTYYIGNLIKIFNGNLYLALAGYNGGPGAAKRWSVSFGGGDMDYFIEYIPLNETKEYVKRVMESYWVYSNIYGG